MALLGTGALGVLFFHSPQAKVAVTASARTRPAARKKEVWRAML